MKKIIIAIVIVFVLGLVGYLYYASASKEKDPTNSSHSVSITVDSLCSIFANNEVKANALYLDKVLDLKGKITDIEKDENRYSLFFKNKDESINISCEMDTTQNNEISNLKIGDDINIKGFCIGMLIDIELSKCRLITTN